MNRISRCTSRMCSRPARPGSIDSRRLVGGVLVAVAAADPLVASAAERPAAVLGRRAVARQQHTADIGRHPGVVECGVQLVDRPWPEGVANLRPVERDANRALVDCAVVGDVVEGEVRHLAPRCRVEQIGDHGPHCAVSGTATFSP